MVADRERDPEAGEDLSVLERLLDHVGSLSPSALVELLDPLKLERYAGWLLGTLGSKGARIVYIFDPKREDLLRAFSRFETRCEMSRSERIRLASLAYFASARDETEPDRTGVDLGLRRGERPTPARHLRPLVVIALLAFSQEARDLVEASLFSDKNLFEPDRTILRLLYDERKSFEEAGRTIGLSSSWARRLHRRAIDRILENLVSVPANA